MDGIIEGVDRVVDGPRVVGVPLKDRLRYGRGSHVRGCVPALMSGAKQSQSVQGGRFVVVGIGFMEAPHGITVNAVCPGLIDTEMVQSNVAPERLEAYRTSFPIQRIGRPEEVADLICFLASERAGYITGAAVDINGGDLMV